MNTFHPYNVHPYADVFPLVGGEDFSVLVEDIKQNGLLEPITLSADGTMIIDGRNRYRACVEATADPVFKALPSYYTEVQILDFIVSKNIQRRHLNPGQKAMAALRYDEFYTAATKAAEKDRKLGVTSSTDANADSGPTGADLPPDSQGARALRALGRDESRRSSARAARVTGASARAVRQAKAVERDTPDLAEQVAAGNLALDTADRERRRMLLGRPKPEPVAPSAVTLLLPTHEGVSVPYPKPKAKATFNQTPGDGISWAAWSWNPVTGCLHGCTYCYARELATSDRFRAAYPAGFTPLFHHERLEAPANTFLPHSHRNDPEWRRVFVCSMADLYGKWVPDEWIDQVHASMIASPEWEYLLLTKFPSRYVKLAMPPGAWVGTSVDTQRRVPIAEEAMRQVVGVKHRWLSLEPLREPLVFSDLSMFDWIVIGAQTETRQPDGLVKASAPEFRWVARILAQADEAGVPVHMKPNLLGATSPNLPGMVLPNEYPAEPVTR